MKQKKRSLAGKILLFLILFLVSLSCILEKGPIRQLYYTMFQPSRVACKDSTRSYLADSLDVYDGYAGSVTYQTAGGEQKTLYIYYEVVSIETKIYESSFERRQYDYNLRAQNAKEDFTQSVVHSGVYSYPVNNPDNAAYEGYYPQFIAEQDAGVAKKLYRQVYGGSASVTEWNTEGADDCISVSDGNEDAVRDAIMGVMGSNSLDNLRGKSTAIVIADEDGNQVNYTFTIEDKTVVVSNADGVTVYTFPTKEFSYVDY